MSDKRIKTLIADTFLEVADALETGQYGKKPVIGFASEGSEHGEDNIKRAMELAAHKGLDARLIEGEDIHKEMEKLLDSGEIDAAVTMHYPFPIGVSTVGKVITPGLGKPMYLATTTGTSDTDRIAGMVKNAIYGIIAAKADGIENPTVGIANIDGARQTEKALLKLKEQGYDINFAESARAGIGDGYDRLIMIVSRASGAPVIAGAMEFATNLVKHNWKKIADDEFAKAKKAGFEAIID